MTERIFGNKGHATKTNDGWVVFIHLDKQHGSAQAISKPVSKEIAEKMIEEIDES